MTPRGTQSLSRWVGLLSCCWRWSWLENSGSRSGSGNDADAFRRRVGLASRYSTGEWLANRLLPLLLPPPLCVGVERQSLFLVFSRLTRRISPGMGEGRRRKKPHSVALAQYRQRGQSPKARLCHWPPDFLFYFFSRTPAHSVSPFVRHLSAS